MKYYVDCIANAISQYPVVRTKEKIIARNFKGVMFDEAEARATRLAAILNRRPTPPASDNKLEDCPFCPNQGWYSDYDRNGEVVQVQCEFCWTNPLSKFNAPATPRECAR